MREEYKAAKRKADKAVREAIRDGLSPYPPVMDSIEEVKLAKSKRSLGLLELPISRIKGNKEEGRSTAFANNFMPLLEENTEFAIKWQQLYDSYKNEGIRDAVKVYEYMHQFYVQEGNKRVSVSRFGGTDYILADVTRVIPVKNDSPEVIAYYEYMEFYKVTKIFQIVFTEPGLYTKLAELVGQDLKEPWPEDLVKDLKSAYYRFERVIGKELNVTNEYVLSNAFLMYLCLFPLKTFDKDTDAQILKNIRLARYELLAENGMDDVEFLAEAPGEVRQSGGIMSIFSREKKYTADKPLKVAFVYDSDPDSSRWTDSHEAGRLYVDAMNEGNIVTSPYFANVLGGTAKALEKAVEDGNEVVFAVSPDMTMDVLRAAVTHHEVKFLNCAIGQNNPSIRCYQGKIYEASFLMGIYCANTSLLDYPESRSHKIGYISRDDSATERANLNAFAIGVSLIDPDCKIVVRKESEDHDGASWLNEDIRIYADIEYSSRTSSMERPGVYREIEGKFVQFGTSYYNWGKYYLQIVNSVLNGTWNISEMIDRKSHATNYWFGLATGVVDIRTPGTSYQTEKMLQFFKNAVTAGHMDPFSGEIRTRGGEVIKEDKAMSTSWLNENIDGEL